MTSTFLTIPLEDILLFLKENQIELPRVTKAKQSKLTELTYTKAWEALSSGGDLIISSLAIEDFIIAYNSQDLTDKKYQTSTLLLSTDEQLRELSNLLGLPVVRKDRLIRILGYLGLLINDASTFDTLPKDALWIIGSNLDCRSIAIFRSISKGFTTLFTDQEVTNMLKVSLHRTTFLDLMTYNRRELDYLCTWEKNQGWIACGNRFTLVVVNPNQVMAWGKNEYGQLGTGKYSNRTTKKPRLIPELKGIKVVAAGWEHSLALDYQGQVYSWGENSRGQLGLGEWSNRPVPTLIPNLEKIKAIFTQGYTSFALTIKGQVYEFGKTLTTSYNGYFGLLNATPQLLDLENIITISVGDNYVLFLSRKGQVFGAGVNQNSRLGFLDQRYYPLTPLSHLEDIVGLSMAGSHSLFLNSQGEAYILGELGQFTQYSEDGSTLLPIKLQIPNRIIAVGYNQNCLFLDNQGKTWKLFFGFGITELELTLSNLPRSPISLEPRPNAWELLGLKGNGDLFFVDSFNDQELFPEVVIKAEVY